MAGRRRIFLKIGTFQCQKRPPLKNAGGARPPLRGGPEFGDFGVFTQFRTTLLPRFSAKFINFSQVLTGLFLFCCCLYYQIRRFCTKIEPAERLLMSLNENHEEKKNKGVKRSTIVLASTVSTAATYINKTGFNNAGFRTT